LDFLHSHDGIGAGSAHKLFLASRASFSSFSSSVSPDAYFRYHQHQAVFDQHLVDVRSVPQEDICKGAPILVLPVGIEGDIFPED
jgi:hypothetical protein